MRLVFWVLTLAGLSLGRSVLAPAPSQATNLRQPLASAAVSKPGSEQSAQKDDAKKDESAEKPEATKLLLGGRLSGSNPTLSARQCSLGGFPTVVSNHRQRCAAKLFMQLELAASPRATDGWISTRAGV